MKLKEWGNLKRGDWIRTGQGKPRYILSVRNCAIRLMKRRPSWTNCNTTTYCFSDRYLFETVEVEK